MCSPTQKFHRCSFLRRTFFWAIQSSRVDISSVFYLLHKSLMTTLLLKIFLDYYFGQLFYFRLKRISMLKFIFTFGSLLEASFGGDGISKESSVDYELSSKFRICSAKFVVFSEVICLPISKVML